MINLLFQHVADSPPFVRYGVNKSLLLSAKAISTTYHADELCGFPANSIGFREPGYIHNALLTGLEPSTFYYYRFGSKEVILFRFADFIVFSIFQ